MGGHFTEVIYDLSHLRVETTGTKDGINFEHPLCWTNEDIGIMKPCVSIFLELI